MTAKAALCQALLDGRVLNVKNVFNTIGLTNCAREISRMVEEPFEVEVSRVHRDGKSRYGQTVTWTDYRLNATDYNKPGIEKMREYVKKQSNVNPRTDKEKQELQQFLNDFQSESPTPITKPIYKEQNLFNELKF